MQKIWKIQKKKQRSFCSLKNHNSLIEKPAMSTSLWVSMSIKVQPQVVIIGHILIKLVLKQTKNKKIKMRTKIEIGIKTTNGWSSTTHKSTIGISLLSSEADALAIKERKLRILKELQLTCCSTNE